MLTSSSVLAVVVALVLVAFTVVAAPAHKCVAGGKVTYQQDPCPAGEVRKRPTIQELNAEEKKRRAAAAAKSPDKLAPAASNVGPEFRCDGRKYCSQMKSCTEAKYFLAHCPGVKMDGDNNGIPCEQQWCGRQP